MSISLKMDKNRQKVIFMLYFLTLVSGYNPISEKVERLLLSLNKLISYYEQHSSEFNFDGIFGLIPLKGALESITNDSLYENLGELKFILSPLTRKFKMQLLRIDAIIGKSVKALRNAEDPYFMEMGKLLTLKWTFPSQVNPYFYPSDVDFIPSVQNVSSDDCIIQLLNANRQGTLDCHLSMKCVAKLMNFQSRSYEMAHQVLYILISHQVDCTMSLSRMLENLSVSLESLKNRLCSIMFEDFLNYYQHVETIPQDRDIFLEQMFVCGGLGYEKFIQLSVLNKFLSWQRPSGCFTISDSAVVKNRQRNVTFMSHKRKLLVERRHADGCLSHMTSVAAAVIGLYLRAFFFPTEYMDAYSFKVTPIVWKLLLVKSYTSLPKLIEDDDDDNKNNNIQTGISNQNIINSFSNRLILVKQPIYVPTGISFGLNYSTHFQNELKAINSEFLIFSILILCSICIFLYLLFRSLIVGCRFFDSSKPTLKI